MSKVSVSEIMVKASLRMAVKTVREMCQIFTKAFD
jgi:hypothetical protein